jgi:hypothetical protein
MDKSVSRKAANCAMLGLAPTVNAPTPSYVLALM